MTNGIIDKLMEDGDCDERTAAKTLGKLLNKAMGWNKVDHPDQAVRFWSNQSAAEIIAAVDKALAEALASNFEDKVAIEDVPSELLMRLDELGLIEGNEPTISEDDDDDEEFADDEPTDDEVAEDDDEDDADSDDDPVDDDDDDVVDSGDEPVASEDNEESEGVVCKPPPPNVIAGLPKDMISITPKSSAFELAQAVMTMLSNLTLGRSIQICLGGEYSSPETTDSAPSTPSNKVDMLAQIRKRLATGDLQTREAREKFLTNEGIAFQKSAKMRALANAAIRWAKEA